MDSLETVEFVLAIEQDGLELSERESAQLAHLCCDPTKVTWLPPDPSMSWPGQVLVFASFEQKVLFRIGEDSKYGVGFASQSGRIEGVCVYGSLSRALFALASDECAVRCEP